MINNNCTYQKAWKKAGILYINDIINKTNGYFMSHDENSNITTNHIVTLQIHSSIPQITGLKTLEEKYLAHL